MTPSTANCPDAAEHMPHTADRDRAGRSREAAETGRGVWVKRWSLSVADPRPRGTGTTDPDPLLAGLPEHDTEDDAGAPQPTADTEGGTGLPAGIERELRAIHSAIADLRREVRELRTGREESG